MLASSLSRYVLWPRIDQKSCLKAISATGLTPVVVENVCTGDELCTDVEEIVRIVDRLGADNVLCVLTTTRCALPA